MRTPFVKLKVTFAVVPFFFQFTLDFKQVIRQQHFKFGGGRMPPLATRGIVIWVQL